MCVFGCHGASGDVFYLAIEFEKRSSRSISPIEPVVHQAHKTQMVCSLCKIHFIHNSGATITRTILIFKTFYALNNQSLKCIVGESNVIYWRDHLSGVWGELESWFGLQTSYWKQPKVGTFTWFTIRTLLIYGFWSYLWGWWSKCIARFKIIGANTELNCVSLIKIVNQQNIMRK